MKHILARSNIAILESFAFSNVLVGLDFDGTLAPIVADPARAAMRPRTRGLLRRVVARYPTVVISGRSRRDLLLRLAGIEVAAAIGGHGIEASTSRTGRSLAVKRWQSRFAAALDRMPGVALEAKPHSLAVHYRRCPTKKAARREIVRLASSLTGVKIIEGKQVFDILPEDAPHKGLALERARKRAACDTAIYVGDDQTDEDVFALSEPGRLLGIRVGRQSDSLAPYFLPRQADIDAFLRTLASIRK